jgi:hypothetical protein
LTKYDPIVSQLQNLKVRIDELKTEQQQVQQKLVGCPDHLTDVSVNPNPIRQALEKLNGSQLLNLITLDLAHVAVFNRQRLRKILPGYPTNLAFGTPDAMTQNAILEIIQDAIIKDEGRSVFSKEYHQWQAARQVGFEEARAPFEKDLRHLDTVKSELTKLQSEYEQIESQLPEYEVTAHGVESQTRSRRVSAKTTVYAISEEEAQEKVEAMQDELMFEEEEFYEDHESEVEIEEYEVELLSEEEGEAAAG